MKEAEIALGERARLSDLMDGRLDGPDRHQALKTVAGNRQFLEVWSTYHLVGDALRSSELALADDDTLFLDRVRLRIEESCSAEAGGQDVGLVVEQPGWRKRLASNGPAYQRVAGGLGAVSLAAVVAWFVAGSPVFVDSAIQLARVALPASLIGPIEPVQSVVMVRDPHLDELLAAHKQSGAPTALQRPAGFLRNAAFDVGLSK